ncbi:zona pellucida-like domain protein [Teladorsagia circumcincta]|uniref:Zona pellucida-like domain protein n=1 Tax=Teladorsagia circumcincta TaxID=45464 RepID=A0A2G9UWB9_TELCI|nr:zona pellucida-like domain protein [Teladorsagia circumcincta]
MARRLSRFQLLLSSPRGLLLASTIIISFHPMFVTKVDKSYRVQCFYAETAKTVTQNLNVSEGNDMQKNVLVIIGDQDAAPSEGRSSNVLHDVAHKLADETLTSTVPLPECRYQVLAGGKDGTPLKFASVGQQVYHEWTCDPQGKNETDSSFCATVHSCNVREEGGREVQLLDENGCAVDRYLLNNLEYTSDLTGGQMSQVFKFADQPSLFFQCQIRLSLKEGPVCKRSSDDCPKTLRGKRSADVEENNVDVISQHMTVFDIDDTTGPTTSRQEKKRGDICISPLAAGSLLSLFASTVMICVLSIVTLNCRKESAHHKLVD